MLLGWNGSTSMNCPLEADIAAAGAAGYDCLELRVFKLDDFLAKRTAADLVDLLKRHNLRALSINSLEKCNVAGTPDFATIQAECHRLCDLAGRIDCEYVIAVPGPKATTVSDGEVFDQTFESLCVLAAIAKRHGCKLAFEFLGFSWCSVRTITECLKIIEATKIDDLGMVIDTFHFYGGDSSLEALNRMDIGRLAILHLADVEDLPKDQLQDANRVFPGDGVVDFKPILRTLAKKNYAGAASIELFRPEYWSWDPAELARLGKRKFLDVCEKAGVIVERSVEI
jgi:2-keto-myo-inositol isomerase